MSDQDDGGGRATDYWATREGTPSWRPSASR